ncbi:MAG: PaaI family thioesterase, partial [Polyangiaceae bacterium]|nr:PaaI family thioesterase [Polyangiaceae bacterium]
PVVIRTEGERVIGELVFEAQHGGAPGFVHGGLVATLLDEVLGHVAIQRGVPVATATLDVRYVAPTPLDVPLRCEAWLVRQTGRRWFIAGEVRAGDVVTARAEAVFFDVRKSSFEAAIRASAARD